MNQKIYIGNRKIFLKFFAVTVFILTFAAFTASAISRVENTVTIENSQKTNLHIVTILKDVNQLNIEVGLPNWTPGYYTTEDYARNVSRLTFADENGKGLYHRKTRDNLWILETQNAKEVKIEFDYTANSYDLNKSDITTNYAILNGTNFFFYVKNHTQDLPASVSFKLPEGWRVATGLSPTKNSLNFTAENYDELVDCPALVGEFDLITLNLRGIPHYWAIAPKSLIPIKSLEKYAADGLKIMDVHTQMFGEIPYKNYWTLNIFNEKGFGGNEHSNSYLGLLPNRMATPETIKNALGTHSHEFFHAFNIKRIRPAEMFPYRYDERNYTPLLWISEGITNYYGARGLLRAGFSTPENYLKWQAQTMAAVQADESAKYVSVEEASIDTWLPDMFQGEQRFAPNYYSRGQIIGLLLDLAIRRDTNNAKSLDDVMRVLYQDFYKKNKGFTTFDLIGAINNLTKKDYKDFFEKYVGGTEPLPYDEVLAFAGLRLVEIKTETPGLGFKTQSGNVMSTITKDGAAEKAGIQKSDAFMGIGNISASNPNWQTEFQNAYKNKIGEEATVYLMRDGKPLTVNLKINAETISTWNLQTMENISPQRRDILNAWKEGK